MTGAKREVGEALKSLERAKEKGSLSEIQAQLQVLAGLTITTDDLKKTRVGYVVKELRKSDNEGVAKAATALFAEWRRAAEGGAKAKAKPKPKPKEKEKADAKAKAPPPSGAESPATPLSNSQPSEGVSAAIGGRKPLDGPRGRLQERFVEYLSRDAPDDAASKARTQYAAFMLEEAMFECSGKKIEGEYKNLGKKLVFALKAEGNTDLRWKILSGDLKAAAVCKMSSEELAAPDVKHRKQQLAKNMMEASMLKKQERAICTHWKCEKCGQNETSYVEMQTRSADEPATVFVHCENPKCGNNWVLDGR